LENEGLNEGLVEALRDSLSKMLGEVNTKTILYFITNEFHIDLKELSDRVADLHKAFVRIFGSRAAFLLENTVAKEFCNKLSQPYDPKETLCEVVERMRRGTWK